MLLFSSLGSTRRICHLIQRISKNIPIYSSSALRINQCGKSNFSTNPNLREEVLDVLQMKSFTEDEFQKSFDSLKIKETDTQIHVNDGFRRLYQDKFPQLQLNDSKLVDINKELLGSLDPSVELDYSQYKERLTKMAEKLDKRVYHIGLSFLLTGMSVGIIIPCMPLLVSQLQITPNAFGIVISAFGLSRLLGNIPSGFLVEKYGRKVTVTSGLIVCGLANFAISFIFLPGLGAPWLVFCRFLAGLGVSAFIAGGHMIMADISTHLNRARTIAPVMASFSAGMALGPAIGGFLLDYIGLTNSYALVGASFGLIALNNQLTMTETKKVLKIVPISRNSVQEIPNPLVDSITSSNNPKQTFSQEFIKAFETASSSWKELMQNPKIKNLAILNNLIWFAMAGAQFTLLPLHLVSDQFHFSSFEIGSCFAYSSIVSFIASQPIAYLSDKFGRLRTLLIGTSLVSGSILFIPMTESLTHLLINLTPLSIGMTALSASTPALITDLTKTEQRAQGMSLFRTSSDLGFLFGATFSGLVATYSSLGTAFVMDGGIILSGMMWFMLQNRLSKKVTEQKKSNKKE